MKLGMDGMFQDSATPADLFQRTTSDPLKKWSNMFTTEIKPSPEACQGGGGERGGGARLYREASGQKAPHQVLLNEPSTAQAVPLSHGHSHHQGGGQLHLHQARVPHAQVSCVHARSHAASSDSASTNTSTNRRFKEQTVEKSSQYWAAMST